MEPTLETALAQTETRVERNMIADLYARRGFKVAIDNLAATGVAGVIGMGVAGVFDADAQATVAGAIAFNASHPFVYGGIAAGMNRLLAKNGYEVPSIKRELSEGYASGAALFFVYNAIVVPTQLSLVSRGADPGDAILWGNLAATTAITPIRGATYFLMDWAVERLKPVGKTLEKQWYKAIELLSRPEAGV